MQMTFEASSSVTLLFDVWSVHGPLGMVLSVLVICLLTVFYEFLKMWRILLGNGSRPLSPFSASKGFGPALTPPPEGCLGEAVYSLDPGRSQSSLTPIDPPGNRAFISHRWLLHGVQTALHVFQVALGYMLMLCVMTYNVWIFLGVLMGSGLGYFLAFPLFGRLSAN